MSMIKLVSDTIDKNDIKNLVNWLSQDEIPRLTKGDITIEFEKKWSNWLGCKYSVFVNNINHLYYYRFLSRFKYF